MLTQGKSRLISTLRTVRARWLLLIDDFLELVYRNCAVDNSALATSMPAKSRWKTPITFEKYDTSSLSCLKIQEITPLPQSNVVPFVYILRPHKMHYGYLWDTLHGQKPILFPGVSAVLHEVAIALVFQDFWQAL